MAAAKKVTKTTTTNKVAKTTKPAAPAKKGAAKKATPAKTSKSKKEEKPKKKGVIATVIEAANNFKEEHPVLDKGLKVLGIGAAIYGAHKSGFWKGVKTKIGQQEETVTEETTKCEEIIEEESNDQQ